MQPFDFDYWKDLAQSNPAEFERKKHAALMDLVGHATPTRQPHLTELVTALCAPQPGTPLERAIAAQKMMLSSVLDLQTQNIELLNAHTGHAKLTEDAALKFSRLVQTT
jgi:hypothetical protein